MRRFPIFNVRSEIVNDDKTATSTFYAFCLSLWNAHHTPLAKIDKPTGGEVVDSEARTAINKIITALEEYGITKE